MIVVSCVLLIAGTGHAQQKEANISFNKTVHDYGKINEEDGNVTHRFEFTNTGSVPLIITRVRPSCGCTSSSWTREPVLPGDKGYVGATYNPKNRPGPFNKSIKVVSNAGNPNTILRIKGDVIPKEKTVEDIYRYSLGNIRLMSNHLSFATIYKGREKKATLGMINVSSQPVRVSFENVPGYLSLTPDPPVLQPNQKGTIEGIYDGEKVNDWGFVISRVYVLLDGRREPQNRLTVSATVQEDFSGLTPEELENAPVFKVKDPVFNFSTIKRGEKVEHEFLVTNNGKSDLIIRKVRASCGCTAVRPENEVIGPGESTKIRVIFNSAGRLGKQNKTVTVITNDPENSRVILWIKGNVTDQG